MKNTKFNIGLLLLLGTLMFSSGLGIALASDDDSDGVDDDYEDSEENTITLDYRILLKSSVSKASSSG